VRGDVIAPSPWAGCEVTDFVVYPPDGTLIGRELNEAANTELSRRGGSDRWGGVHPSGEVEPYAIAWMDTCTGAIVIEEPGS